MNHSNLPLSIISRFRSVCRWVLVVLIFTTSCNLPISSAPSPTLNVTQAYQTVEARLTQAIAMTPLITLSPLPSLSATATTGLPSPTLASTATSVSTPLPTITTSAALCDQAAPGSPIDVTIPDDTIMQPGQSFTKTWRLLNAGTCTWTSEYALVWFSGEQMGAPLTIPLNGEVAPGQMVDLSVDMVAPETPAKYQSNWKLRNAQGVLFGIGPNAASAFWVRIEVLPSVTLTPSATLPIAVTPTHTPTPSTYISGSATLNLNDQLDLDTNRINSGGEDLAFVVGDQVHLIDPIGGAAMAVFGESQPNLVECQSITLSADPLIIEDNLPVGIYLCYRTNMALPGWARVSAFDAETPSLSLEITTWSLP